MLFLRVAKNSEFMAQMMPAVLLKFKETLKKYTLMVSFLFQMTYKVMDIYLTMNNYRKNLKAKNKKLKVSNKIVDNKSLALNNKYRV